MIRLTQQGRLLAAQEPDTLALRIHNQPIRGAAELCVKATRRLVIQAGAR